MCIISYHFRAEQKDQGLRKGEARRLAPEVICHTLTREMAPCIWRQKATSQQRLDFKLVSYNFIWLYAFIIILYSSFMNMSRAMIKPNAYFANQRFFLRQPLVIITFRWGYSLSVRNVFSPKQNTRVFSHWNDVVNPNFKKMSPIKKNAVKPQN